jgi:hypothetical protein
MTRIAKPEAKRKCILERLTRSDAELFCELMSDPKVSLGVSNNSVAMLSRDAK